MLSFSFHNSRRNAVRTFIARHVAPLVLLLFLYTQFHAVLHHHDDLDDHPDCSICAVAHHQAADSSSPLPYSVPTPSVELTRTYAPIIQLRSSFFQTHFGRAPPLF